jgi:hypothetical protein
VSLLRILKSIAVAIAAVVILFEEWLWEPLKRLMMAFSRLPVIRQLAALIARLPPFAALVLYLVPVVVLLPFKIAGLWLIGQGHSIAGLTTFLGAKIVGTALLAWLFSLTKPALMQIGWFAQGYDWVTRVSTAAHEWLHRQPIYQATKRLLTRIRIWISSRLRGDSRKSP